MLTVIETPIFQSMAASVWSEAQAEEFVSFISENPQSGEVTLKRVVCANCVGRGLAWANVAA